jgi:molybdate transport system substrate-binding protein
VPKASELRIERPGDLKSAAHLAMGDPEVVPAGKYAKKWLESAGVWTEVREHVVPSLDVRAALAAVESGRAEAGVVYATDAASSSRVRVVFEAKEGAPEIAYVRALLTRSKLQAAALFAEFLGGSEARASFLRHGFIL